MIAQSPAEGTNGWYKYTFTIPSTFNTATNYVILKQLLLLEKIFILMI
ncbi:MAG: hypothetical protein IPL12_09285 [Bacteroidetes bacterium]|nr:hypothetical protein [Bacteroidota bacterium]